MKSFAKLYARAADQKGGSDALESMISRPKSAAALARTGDDRWLSAIAKSVFQAGFNWQVVENKWSDIENAYNGFNPRAVALQSDDDLEALLKDRRVIRQWRKLKAIRTNANYLVSLAEDHGSAARFFARYPREEYINLLGDLKTHGSYLGGTTAQYFLRRMGKDSFILSSDVVAALRREKVFDGSADSKSSRRAIQDAFNYWVDDGGGSLTRVSRVLAFTVG